MGFLFKFYPDPMPLFSPFFIFAQGGEKGHGIWIKLEQKFNIFFGREGKEREGKGREGKGREGKGREGREGKGKERKGKEREGKERKGKERKGKERKGKERTGTQNPCPPPKLLLA